MLVPSCLDVYDKILSSKPEEASSKPKEAYHEWAEARGSMSEVTLINPFTSKKWRLPPLGPNFIYDALTYLVTEPSFLLDWVHRK